MPNEDKEFIKSRLKDSAFTSSRSYNYNSEINVTKNERYVLYNLSAIIKISSSKNLTKATVLFFLKNVNNLKECPKY